MKVSDVLNLNLYKMRHSDNYVIVLKSGSTCFTLGKTRFRAWTMGELDLSSYVYTNMCLEKECEIKVIRKDNHKLIKMYIDDEDLQAEIYLMEDRDYNKRLKGEALR